MDCDEFEFRPPYFEFKDIKPEDLRELKYVDPYYYMRRPIEPERLKSIYQQAFIYDLLYRFAKEHLPEIPHRRDGYETSNTKSTDTETDSIKEKVLAYLFKSQSNVEIKQSKQELTAEKEEVNIWRETDMAVLRRNWHDMKEENMHLKSILSCLQDDMARTRDRLVRAEHELKQANERASATHLLEQENDRLYIRVRELETRYDAYSHELTDVDKWVAQVKRAESEARARASTLGIEKCRLQFELNKCRMRLKMIKSEWTNRMEERCESVRLEYMKQITSLKRSLNELQEKLAQEKAEHDKCKKALENLRTHFMSTEFDREKATSRTFEIDETKIRIFN